MKRLSTTLLAAALVSCENPADKTSSAEVSEAQTALAESGTKFTFTDSSTIGFTGSKVTGSKDGGFKDFTGHFTLDDDGTAPTSGTITIQMDSTYSDAEKLTTHLKGVDFFAVEQFPTATFTMTKVTDNGSGTFELSGNFTLHGITKNITFPATASRDGNVAKVQAEFDINRQDFGISFPGKKDDLIRDEVIIRFDLEAKAE